MSQGLRAVTPQAVHRKHLSKLLNVLFAEFTGDPDGMNYKVEHLLE